MMISAKYEDGVFKPIGAVSIAEGTVVDINVPAPKANGLRSIGDLEFAGMWADRDDIKDGVSYVNDLRDNLRPARDDRDM